MWERVQRVFGTGVPSFPNEVENTASLPQQRPWASQVGVPKYAFHYQDLCRNHLGDWYLLGCYFQKWREPRKGFSSCQSCHYWWEPLGCACKLRGKARSKSERACGSLKHYWGLHVSVTGRGKPPSLEMSLGIWLLFMLEKLALNITCTPLQC